MFNSALASTGGNLAQKLFMYALNYEPCKSNEVNLENFAGSTFVGLTAPGWSEMMNLAFGKGNPFGALLGAVLKGVYGNLIMNGATDISEKTGFGVFTFKDPLSLSPCR